MADANNLSNNVNLSNYSNAQLQYESAGIYVPYLNSILGGENEPVIMYLGNTEGSDGGEEFEFERRLEYSNDY